jgi:hypothetical protein
MKLLGIDWGDVGKSAFGGLHLAGKTVASAFGFGSAAQSLEQLEAGAGLLPDWAKSTPGIAQQGGAAISNPDYVVIQPQGSTTGTTIVAPAGVAVVGGRRFDGNGYQHGEPFGKRFSFGYDSPARVDITAKDGKKTSLTTVQKVLFCGGAEQRSAIMGFDFDDEDLLGETPGDFTVGHYHEPGLLGETPGDFTVGRDLAELLPHLGPTRGIPSPTASPRRLAPPRATRAIPSPEQARNPYLVGADMLGATTLKKPGPRAGFVTKTAPATGRQYVAIKLNAPHGNSAKAHAASIANARDAAKHATQVASSIKQQLAKTKVIGAAATGMSHLMAAKLAKAADALSKTASKTKSAADSHEKFVSTSASKLKAGVAAAKKQAHIIGAHWEEIVGAHWEEIIGDEEMSAAVACLVGQTDDSTPPPADSGTAPATAVPGPGTPGPEESALGPAPTTAPPLVPGVDFTPEPTPASQDTAFYDSSMTANAGVVYYDGSLKFSLADHNTVGSFSRMYQPISAAAAGGGAPGDASGFELHDDGWYYYYASNYHDAVQDQRWQRAADETAQQRSDTSKKNGWGPIVGNPNGWTAGLRLETDTGKFFWFRDKAPAQFTAADDLARLNKARLDYQTQLTAARADDLQAAAQDKANQKTANDIAAQTATQAAQQAQQLQAAQAAADVAATQQATQQAALEQAQQQAELEAAKQQSALDIQMQQAQLQYAQQHPEVFAPPAAPDQGPPDQGPPPDEGPQEEAPPSEENVDWGESSSAETDLVGRGR